MRSAVYILSFLLIVTIFYGCGNSASIKENGKVSNDFIGNEEITDSVSAISIPAIEVRKTACDIADADSIESFFYTDGNSEKLLFRVVSGGNIVWLNDTIINLNNAKYALFTIADYGQEDQIYYLIYDIADEQIKQSERINLPSFGLNISSYRQISPVSVDPDSIRIMISDAETIFPIGLTHLDCVSAQIINYYEYE